ncbi:uncharacterized protein BT62DRAFT_1077579 [Guyanagaster necrorhizus]|uniref:Uncharacterized protein n=1 Tax=Guyanagaster necrorhizus TaxID=856835 RepID=A0A9P8AQY2_9AGAR|nr:uncharacterized protein BT62DRAFT_1077579 [Guyanagaster necrorhizus MCA 3950]KAG7444828.1 hypothetical protein BT62DRAFT_1077579 [Guyanagaster necrorhizus MCA 3950]
MPYSSWSPSEARLRRNLTRRYLHKLNKNLKKSTSLPVLRLVPTDRPFFTCNKCGFSSTTSPPCMYGHSDKGSERATGRIPHRRWTFTASTGEYVNLCEPAGGLRASVHQRLHVPHLLPSTPPPASPHKLRHSWSQAGNITVDQWTGLLSSPAPVVPDNKRPLLPCVEEDDPAVTDINLSPLPTLNLPSDQLPALVNPSTVCNETVASECPQVATVTTLSYHKKVRDETLAKLTGRTSRRLSVEQGTSTPLDLKRASFVKGVDHRNTDKVVMNAKSSAKSLRPSTAPQSGHSYHDVLVKKFSAEQRVLRRKQPMEKLRVSAPASPAPTRPVSVDGRTSRRPVSQPPQSSHDSITSSISLSIPITKLHGLRRSNSQSYNIPRLGHPHRPYYSSVIRKDLSRPTSPQPEYKPSESRPTSPMSLRPSSPGHGMAFSGRTSSVGHDFDLPTPPDLDYSSTFPSASTGYSPGEFGYIPPVDKLNNMGFSMSGEAELRMALASGDDAGSFKFKDMSPKPRLGVRSQVKKFGKGLKNRLFGK